MVKVRGDAGQVVAGDSIVNIDNHFNAPKFGVLFLAFF
jgi:hypothetical protein